MSIPKVDVRHPSYTQAIKQWDRCRDSFNGGDAVKAKGAQYLPVPEAMDVATQMGQARYAAYKLRALWYGATTRTVEGLAGSVFQKRPEWTKLDKGMEDQLLDVTLTSVPADLHMLLACREVFITGRAGQFVDYSEGAEGRPYWRTYPAENITNWRTDLVDGKPVLTMVALMEAHPKDKDDPFNVEFEVRYRVLTLGRNGYTMSLYREAQAGSQRWEMTKATQPMRRGKALPFIPFVFLSPTTVEPDVQRPPLLDLVDVNLSHFRTSADLEHGEHYCGTPQLVIIGGLSNNGKPVQFGSGRALLLPKDGDAKVLQADSRMMGALVSADERKRKLMATLGARLIEGAPNVERDTATAVMVRHSAEHANIRTIAGAMEQGFTRVARIHEWWMGTAPKVETMDATVTLNKDYLATKMTPEELKSWILALQAEAISHETFWLNLERGGVSRPETTSEEERDQIEKETPEVDMAMPNGNDGPDGAATGAGGFKVVNVEGSWQVQDASGKVTPGGNFGNDQAAAKRARAKLAGGGSK